MTFVKKNILRKIVNYSFPLILSGVFLYFAFQGVDLDKVMIELGNISYFWTFVAGITLMLAHYLRAVRWKIILNSVKPDTSIKNLFGALMIGYGVNCVVPRLGEFSRAVLIGKWEGLSRSSMFGTVIVERVIDLIFLGIAVYISILIWSSDLFQSFAWLKSTLIITSIVMISVLILLFMVIKMREKFYGIFIKIINRFSKKFAEKLSHIFEMLIDGFASLKGIKNYLLTLILSVVIIFLYAAASYFGFFMLGMENIQNVDFRMGWVLMSISSIGVVIPTPGGTGSYHTLTKSALVLLFGFAEEISLAYAIITHFLSYVLFIITAVVFYLILHKKEDSFLKIVDTEV